MLPLLLVAALASSASAHTLSVVYAKGGQSFSRKLAVEAGKGVNEIDKVSGRDMVVNAVLGVDSRKPGLFSVEFQSELSRKGGGDETIQFQGALELAPGTSIVALRCDGWTVTLGVDGQGAPVDAPWEAGLDDARLTLVRGRDRCSRVGKVGSQSNFVHGGLTPSGRWALILNDVLAANPEGYQLEYQLEDTRRGGKLQKQNRLALAPGKPVADGQAGSFLLEARPAGARAPAAPAAAASKPEPEHGTVQLLR